MRGSTRHISVSFIMDPGLSLRTQKALKELAAATCAAAPPIPKQQQQQQRHHHAIGNKESSLPPVFDLSRAANEVAHAELLEFFKSTAGENVTSEVRVEKDNPPAVLGGTQEHKKGVFLKPLGTSGANHFLCVNRCSRLRHSTALAASHVYAMH